MSREGDAQAADDTGKLGEAAGGGDVTGAEAGAQPTAAAPATSVAGTPVTRVARVLHLLNQLQFQPQVHVHVVLLNVSSDLHVLVRVHLAIVCNSYSVIR